MDRFSELGIEDEYENPPKNKTEVQAAPEKARNSRQSCLKVQAPGNHLQVPEELVCPVIQDSTPLTAILCSLCMMGCFSCIK